MFMKVFAILLIIDILFPFRFQLLVNNLSINHLLHQSDSIQILLTSFCFSFKCFVIFIFAKLIFNKTFIMCAFGMLTFFFKKQDVAK